MVFTMDHLICIKLLPLIPIRVFEVMTYGISVIAKGREMVSIPSHDRLAKSATDHVEIHPFLRG